MTIIVKTNKDADEVKSGDAYVIDVWPEPPNENTSEADFLIAEEKAQAKYDRLEARIQANLEKEKSNNGNGQGALKAKRA